MGLTQKLGTIPLAIQTDSSNNVGIGGAANASYKLAVTGASLFSSSIGATSATFSDTVAITLTASDSRILGGNSTGRLLLANSGTSTYGIFYGASHATAPNAISFATDNTERLRITNTGNVGIGTSSPAGKLEVSADQSSNNQHINITGTQTSYNQSYSIGIPTSTKDLRFYDLTAGSERMRITSGGNVLIGATSVPSGAAEFVTGSLFVNANLYIGNTNGTTGRAFRFDGFANGLYGLWSDASGVDQTGVVLNYGAGSWTSTSDERLKDINSNIENAVDKLKTLRAINYSWKSDETKKENLGLIAQDVEKVFPQVVDTIKDGYLGVRYTELIPVLVKAIQELNAKVTALENK